MPKSAKKDKIAGTPPATTIDDPDLILAIRVTVTCSATLRMKSGVDHAKIRSDLLGLMGSSLQDQGFSGDDLEKGLAIAGREIDHILAGKRRRVQVRALDILGY